MASMSAGRADNCIESVGDNLCRPQRRACRDSRPNYWRRERRSAGLNRGSNVLTSSLGDACAPQPRSLTGPLPRSQASVDMTSSGRPGRLAPRALRLFRRSTKTGSRQTSRQRRGLRIARYWSNSRSTFSTCPLLQPADGERVSNTALAGGGVRYHLTRLLLLAAAEDFCADKEPFRRSPDPTAGTRASPIG